MDRRPILEIHDLVTQYPSVEPGKTVKAVDGVSLTVRAGEVAAADRAGRMKRLLDQVGLPASDGRLFFNILATFAEFEADLFRMRSCEGMAVVRQAGGKARARSKHLPDVTICQGAAVVDLMVYLFAMPVWGGRQAAIGAPFRSWS